MADIDDPTKTDDILAVTSGVSPISDATTLSTVQATADAITRSTDLNTVAVGNVTENGDEIPVTSAAITLTTDQATFNANFGTADNTAISTGPDPDAVFQEIDLTLAGQVNLSDSITSNASFDGESVSLNVEHSEIDSGMGFHSLPNPNDIAELSFSKIHDEDSTIGEDQESDCFCCVEKIRADLGDEQVYSRSRENMDNFLFLETLGHQRKLLNNSAIYQMWLSGVLDFAKSEGPQCKPFSKFFKSGSNNMGLFGPTVDDYVLFINKSGDEE